MNSDFLISFGKSVWEYLAAHVPVLQVVVGWVFVVGLVVSALIEIAEFFVRLSASPKDDEAVASIKSKFLVLQKYLEFIPHANLPVAAWASGLILKVRKGAAAAQAAKEAWDKA